ncbi:MAG: calcium/proton exchanger [Candidatus Binataceae bacterium]
MTRLLTPRLDWLLVFVPAAIALEWFTPASHASIFVTACLAIIPLAGWMGRATEHLAEKTGDGVGGLLNATFGNAAEMIIAAVALRRGLTEVVEASITGSIIGNILLVLGGALLAGGLRYPSQRFNLTAARSQATMLLLAAAALVSPTAYHYFAGPAGMASERSLSVEISLVLLATYLLGLLFTLRTHRQLFTGHRAEAATVEQDAPRPWSLQRSLVVLGVATAFVMWVSEILVGSVEHAAATMGMTGVFVGVFVVAIIGNAAEHSTAILVALKDRMDLALGIAVGSSIQIALFVAPLLVLASYLLGPTPMDLVFTPPEVLAVVLAVTVTVQISGDGESNWLEGVQLLAVYVILALMFYFLPATSA